MSTSGEGWRVPKLGWSRGNGVRWADSSEAVAGRLDHLSIGSRSGGFNGNIQAWGRRWASFTEVGNPDGWAPGSLGKKMNHMLVTLSLRSPWVIWVEMLGSALRAFQVS